MKKMMIGFLALVYFASTGLFAGNDKGGPIKASNKGGPMMSPREKVKRYAQQIANEPRSRKNKERAEAIIEIVAVME